jgi:hypothetical protein
MRPMISVAASDSADQERGEDRTFISIAAAPVAAFSSTHAGKRRRFQ